MMTLYLLKYIFILMIVLIIIINISYYFITYYKNRLFLKILNDVVSVLDKNRVKYFLDFGTLLGAYRKNDFLRNDTDVDIGIVLEDPADLSWLPAKSALSEKYFLSEDEEGFSLSVKRASKFRTIRDLIHLDVYLYTLYPRNGAPAFVNTHGTAIPEGHILPLERIRLRNREFSCPNKSRSYLEEIYICIERHSVHLGQDRYRPCSSLGDYLSFYYNLIIFYRFYFIIKFTPIPYSLLPILEQFYKKTYQAFFPEPKL